MSAIEQDNFARDWNKEFFKNGATPGGVLQFEGNLTPAEHKKLENEWNDRYKGATKAHRTAVLAGGLKYTPVGSTQHDMDFVSLRTFSRDEVLALFRVPKTVLGITDGTQTRASAETSEYVFMKETIKPKMKKIVDTLNEFLLSMYEEDGLYFSFVDPVPENRELIMAEYQNGLANGWLSINEVRRQEGLPDVQNGDAVMVPFSVSPLGEPIKAVKAEKPRSKIEQAAHDIAMAVAPAIKVVADMQAFEKRGEVHWKSQIDRATPYEKQIAKTMDEFFSTQQERVLTALDDKLGKSVKRKASTPDVFDDDSEEEELIKAVKSIFATIVAAEGTAALEEIGLDEAFNDRAERVQRALARHLKKFAGAVTEETSKQIREAIAEGLTAGEDLRGVRKRVQELSAFGRARSEVIARTEVTRAQNFASIQAWKESGLVEKKVWWTALDERVEEECASRHGEEYDLEENVDKGNSYGPVDGPPLHPNCVLPDMMIISPDAESLTRAFYDGPSRKIIFSNGRSLSVTPNHVLLTSRGFVAAHLLRKGDKILKATCLNGVVTSDPNTNDRPATIENVVDALSVSSSVSTTRVPVSSEHLHGDGKFIDGNIDVITSHGSLRGTLEATGDKTLKQFSFNPTLTETLVLTSKCDLASMLLGLSAAADGIVSGTGVEAVLFGGALTDEQSVRFHSAANYDARMVKASQNSGTADLESLSEFCLRNPALVEFDEVLDIEDAEHRGYVYDVSTTSQLYTANGYITSNCRCTLLPVVTSKSQTQEEQKGNDALARKFDQYMKTIEAIDRV